MALSKTSRVLRLSLVLSLLASAACLDAGDAPSDEPGGVDPGAGSPLRPLQLDDRGPEVRRVYEYLKRFGYFPNPDLQEFAGWRPVIDHELADPERFDADLEQAVFLYQLAQGLPADGTLNAATVALMARPRCSFPDYYGVRQAKAAGVASFVASGARWGKSNITYSFNNFTGDLSNDAVRADIRNSLNRWAGVTPLSFTEVGSGSGDMRIGFYYGDHGDGYPFDAQYGVLAHAFYPPTAAPTSTRARAGRTMARASTSRRWPSTSSATRSASITRPTRGRSCTPRTPRSTAT